MAKEDSNRQRLVAKAAPGPGSCGCGPAASLLGDFAYDALFQTWMAACAAKWHVKDFVEEKLLRGGRRRGPPEGGDLSMAGATELPGEWPALTRGGQLWAGLILSTSFSHKYKGANMKPGESVTVKHPTKKKGDDALTWQAKLLDVSGNKEGVAMIWLGDEAHGDRTIYVAMSMLRNFRQVRKINYSKLETGRGGSGSEKWESMHIASYIRWKVDKMWDNYDLGNKLDKVVKEYPEHRIMFAGISHGASLAQVAALRFALTRPKANTCCAAWNAYRWTDQDGSEIVRSTFGDKMLTFVLMQWAYHRGLRIWDALSDHPHDLAILPNVWLLDTDSGGLAAEKQVEGFPGKAFWDFEHFDKGYRLHYASIAIKATRLAVAADLPQKAA